MNPLGIPSNLYSSGLNTVVVAESRLVLVLVIGVIVTSGVLRILLRSVDLSVSSWIMTSGSEGTTWQMELLSGFLPRFRQLLLLMPLVLLIGIMAEVMIGKGFGVCIWLFSCRLTMLWSMVDAWYSLAGAWNWKKQLVLFKKSTKTIFWLLLLQSRLILLQIWLILLQIWLILLQIWLILLQIWLILIEMQLFLLEF